MNDRSQKVWSKFLLGFSLVAVLAFPVGAEKLHFSKVLDDREKQCLNQMIYASGWRDSPEFWSEMRRIAVVARAHLDGKRYVDYFFLFEADGWCGTGGCALLIAELKKGNSCRLLYDDAGFDNIDILSGRDYGYHRLYTPCEVRFDGRQYQQLHPECPTVDIQR